MKWPDNGHYTTKICEIQGVQKALSIVQRDGGLHATELQEDQVQHTLSTRNSSF